ncbi:MAG: glutamine-hydrolyzing GMP synthase, partial [Spirochaetes bacterium]|nr:glutamine-hydrolyzing GMP synthase [Spirochaetota bacterium]
MNNKEICPVIILDYGSQYTQLIARKIREQNIFCKIFRYDTPISMIKNLSPEAIILSGGPASVYDKDAPDLDMTLLGLDIPILGICYGMQLIIKKLSGKVSRTEKGREYGKSSITINDTDSKLFLDLDSSQQVWMSHGDSVTDLPEDFSIIAKSDSAIAAIANPKKNIYLVQFHPEVIHTTNGVKILKNFLFKISGIKPLWDMGSFIEKSIEEIKKTVGNKTVLCGISGGVDSSVLAVLLHKAIGDQLKCIFVDNGLLR